MSAFSVRESIREVIESSALSDPRDVAAKVAEMVPADELRAVLAEVLPVYVRTAFSRSRLLNPGTPAAAPTTSAKVAAVRDSWAARLATPLLVAGEWKRLADCTAGDLRTVAASLRESAARTEAKAAWYEALADSLPRGATVAALDSDPLAEDA